MNAFMSWSVFNITLIAYFNGISAFELGKIQFFGVFFGNKHV